MRVNALCLLVRERRNRRMQLLPRQPPLIDFLRRKRTEHDALLNAIGAVERVICPVLVGALLIGVLHALKGDENLRNLIRHLNKII